MHKKSPSEPENSSDSDDDELLPKTKKKNANVVRPRGHGNAPKADEKGKPEDVRPSANKSDRSGRKRQSISESQEIPAKRTLRSNTKL